MNSVTRHLRPRGRFWIDIFNPDLRLTAENKLINLEPTAFFVPSLGRAVFRVTDIQRSGPQTDRVVFRYQAGDNPNGSARNIAGILSEKRNVLGLMPHPERVVDPLLGGTDGRALFESLIETLS